MFSEGITAAPSVLNGDISNKQTSFRNEKGCQASWPGAVWTLHVGPFQDGGLPKSHQTQELFMQGKKIYNS